MNWKPESKSPRRPDGHRTVLVGSAQGASNQEGRSESERTNRRKNPPHEADSSGILGDVKSSLDLLDESWELCELIEHNGQPLDWEWRGKNDKWKIKIEWTTRPKKGVWGELRIRIRTADAFVVHSNDQSRCD